MKQSGFLVTCHPNKVFKTKKELAVILSSIESEEDSDIEYGDDILSKIKEEVNSKKFKICEIHRVKNTFFVHNNAGIDILEIYNRFFFKRKFYYKIKPLEKIFYDCKNILDELKEYVEKIDGKYRIEYKKRYNDKSYRDQILEFFGGNVPHKMSFNSPEYVITVDIVRNYVGIGFYKLSEKKAECAIEDQ